MNEKLFSALVCFLVVQEVGTYNFIIGDLVEVITTKGKTRVSPSGIR